MQPFPTGAAPEGIIAAVRQQLGRGATTTELVNVAIACRDQGAADVSAQVLRELIELEPTAGAAYYELAFLHRLKGEHLQAATLLADSLRRAGTDARTQIFLAHMLYALGAHAEADQTLDSTSPTDAGQAQELAAMFELGAYLRAFPLGRALFMLEQLKARHRYLPPTDTAGVIEAALRERAPFALVRLGDGEGGCLTLGQADEHAYRLLYAQNRAEFISMWFGPDFQPSGNGFLEVIKRLLQETLTCEVIGVPYPTWLEHEYAICSLRGIPSLVNVIRALLVAEAPAGRMLCRQRVHVDLHGDGLLEPILRKERRISIITCLAELPVLLKRRYGLQDVTLYRIPGERGSAALLGREAVEGSHYPAKFEELQAALSQPHEGRLFLVAGGVLGKFYAATIRRHGGIALDIGSLADGWAGRYTRPSYDSWMKI